MNDLYTMKQKYLLAALVTRGFNQSKTAREIGVARGTLRKYCGHSKKEAQQLAQSFGLL